MSGANVFILMAVFAGIELFVMPLVIGAVVDANWNPISDRYPRMPAKSDAVRRNFQSFAVGVLSLGWCIHVAADDSHLHLSPCWFARRMRARAASVPWSKIELSRSVGKYASVRLPELPAINLRGPRWCLELAQPRSL